MCVLICYKVKSVYVLFKRKITVKCPPPLFFFLLYIAVFVSGVSMFVQMCVLVQQMSS